MLEATATATTIASTTTTGTVIPATKMAGGGTEIVIAIGHVTGATGSIARASRVSARDAAAEAAAVTRIALAAPLPEPRRQQQQQQQLSLFVR